jgi:glycine dehydrogenase subunit 1
MALSIKSDRSEIILPETLHPDYHKLAGTYLSHFDSSIALAPAKDGITNVALLKKLAGQKTAAIVIQHPNYFGCLEEAEEISRIAHDCGALLIAVADPISLGLLAPPGAYGADIAIGEGQCLGLHQYAGGETLGVFTCARDFIRKVPGRLVGVARDRENRRGFVLTLQTREQHIRRGKATSNICTNHAHNALRATIYLCLMGPQGVARVARACARNTQRLRSAIEEIRPEAIAFKSPVFKELVIRCSGAATETRDALFERGFMAGVPLNALGDSHNNHLLVAVTEKRTDVEIDDFANVLGEYL